jgi:hypothetical protein
MTGRDSGSPKADSQWKCNFSISGGEIGPPRGPTYQPRAEPVPTGVALGLTVLMDSALKGRNISPKARSSRMAIISRGHCLLYRTYSAKAFFHLTQGAAGGRLCPGLICIVPSGLWIFEIIKRVEILDKKAFPNDRASCEPHEKANAFMATIPQKSRPWRRPLVRWA